MNRPLLPALVAAACVLASTPAVADEEAPHTGQITGIVVDARTGAPLPMARVVLQCACLPAPREATTSARGLYVFRDLPPGTFRIEVANGRGDEVKTVSMPASAKFRANFRVTPHDAVQVDGVTLAGTPSAEGVYAIRTMPVGGSNMSAPHPKPLITAKERLAAHRKAAVKARDAEALADTGAVNGPPREPTALPAVEPEDATQPLPDALARQIVYSGAMDLAVFDVDATRERVEALVVEAGGFVQIQRGHAMVVRVPAEEFRTVLDAIGKLGRVERQELEALDVTEDYYDLQTRIEVLRRTQAQLLELLDKARTVEQALAVRRELDAVILELESLLGRERVLASQIRYSALSLGFVERVPQSDVPSTNDPFPWVDEIGVEGTAWR